MISESDRLPYTLALYFREKENGMEDKTFSLIR